MDFNPSIIMDFNGLCFYENCRFNDNTIDFVV